MGKFTTKKRKIILQSIRAGSPISTAAQAAGVTRKTIYDWINKGKRERKGKYYTFYTELKKAEAQAENHAVAVIRAAMQESWQAAAWYLERRRPYEWSKHEYKHHTTSYEDMRTEDLWKELETRMGLLPEGERKKARKLVEKKLGTGKIKDEDEEDDD